MDVQCLSESSIKLIDHSIIKPTGPNAEPYLLPISNLDYLWGRFPVTFFYLYRKPPMRDFSSVVAAIKTSLSDILTFFPPFAGRIVQNKETGEVEILCNGEGLKLIQAVANVSLASLDFYNLDRSMKNLLPPFDHEIPLSLQITIDTCEGFSLAWSFDHLLADCAGMVKFLTMWSEMARTKKISSVPNHNRSWLRVRSPPAYSPSFDRNFTICTLDEIIASPPRSTIRRLYYIKGSTILRLQGISSEGGKKRTRTEALSAYIWKMLARSLDQTGNCKMGWLVDGRTRVGSIDPESMLNYIGNMVSMAVGEASFRELKEGSMSHVAAMVSCAIRKVTNEAHFLELNDWIKSQRRGMVFPKIFLDLGEPAVVVSSCHHLPVMSTDFGFGLPLVMFMHTVIEKLGMGYVNLVSSGKGDGSWLAFSFLWPELAAELESDPDCVFQPMTSAHIGL